MRCVAAGSVLPRWRARGRKSFVTEFYPLFSKDSNGSVCVNGGSNKVLMSAKVDTGGVNRTLFGVNITPRDLGTIFIARRRSSRVGNLHMFTSGCRVGMCKAGNALSTLSSVNVLGNGFRARRISFSNGRTKPLFIAPFRASRSTERDYKCGVSYDSNEGVSVTASLNRVARRIFSTMDNSSLIVLRSGRSIVVLRGNPCPCSLGGEVLNGGKRLSGSTYTDATRELMDNNAAEVCLNRLDHRGGVPTLTCRAAYSTLAVTKTGRGDSCVLGITGPIYSRGTVVL